MDLDGDLDIVALGYRYPWLKLFWNDGGYPLTWREEDVANAIVTPLVLGAGDLDGDGDMDVAVTADAWNRVIWWQSSGGSPADWTSASVASQFPIRGLWPWPMSTVTVRWTFRRGEWWSTVAWWRLLDIRRRRIDPEPDSSIPTTWSLSKSSIDAIVPPETEIVVALRYGDPSELGEWIVPRAGPSSRRHGAFARVSPVPVGTWHR